MLDEGMVPSYGVTGASQKIRIYSTNAADVGKFVVIQGNDSNGNWVRTTFADGTVQDGEQVALVAPSTYVDTVTTWAVGAPYADYEDVTAYRVLGYAVVDAGLGTVRQIFEWGPSDTNPTYRKMRIPGVRHSSNGCDCNSTVRALASLQAG